MSNTTTVVIIFKHSEPIIFNKAPDYDIYCENNQHGFILKILNDTGDMIESHTLPWDNIKQVVVSKNPNLNPSVDKNKKDS